MSFKHVFPAFGAVFLADLAVRTAYMAGKSPVLPVFAGDLGANEILLGAIVAISTVTGLGTKPLFGVLSDRFGQWLWLFLGTALFTFTPLLYLCATAPEDLIGLRLFHGLATAIYGPVTLAFVAGIGERPRAEWFGWFTLSRTAGYILGPLIGGALLNVLPAALVMAATSLIAVLAFLPILALRNCPHGLRKSKGTYYRLKHLPQVVLRNRPLMVFGCVEMTSRIGIYAVKTFLPLMILAQGGTPLQAGIFLSVQETAVALTRPIAGHIADKWIRAEHCAVIGLGITAAALGFLTHAPDQRGLLFLAAFIGIGNGAYHPAALLLIAKSTTPLRSLFR